MSLRKVKSPDAPKITTLHGCGIGRLDKPSRSGLADNSLLTEKGAEHGPLRRGLANSFPPKCTQFTHGHHESDRGFGPRSSGVRDPAQEQTRPARPVLDGEKEWAV